MVSSSFFSLLSISDLHVLLVRNRSKELAELLGDLDRVRQERRKAKANRNKYVGTGNDGMSFSSGGSRYGGFGSEDVGASSGYGGGYDRDRGGRYVSQMLVVNFRADEMYVLAQIIMVVVVVEGARVDREEEGSAIVPGRRGTRSTMLVTMRIRRLRQGAR